MNKEVIYYAVILEPLLGDEKDEVVIEIRRDGTLYRISASPARNSKRGEASWMHECGKHVFRSVDEAKQAVEQYHGKLDWAQKQDV